MTNTQQHDPLHNYVGQNPEANTRHHRNLTNGLGVISTKSNV